MVSSAGVAPLEMMNSIRDDIARLELQKNSMLDYIEALSISDDADFDPLITMLKDSYYTHLACWEELKAIAESRDINRAESKQNANHCLELAIGAINDFRMLLSLFYKEKLTAEQTFRLKRLERDFSDLFETCQERLSEVIDRVR